MRTGVLLWQNGGAQEKQVEKFGKVMFNKPKDITDYYSQKFQTLFGKLGVSYDYFIRTTMPKHYASAQKLWEICTEKGDLFKDVYEGWYNTKEECYVTDNDALLHEYKDPGSGHPYNKLKEESYFFRMSKYCDQLIQHIRENPTFIQPESHRNQILQRLTTDGLRDLSTSRSTFSWGVPVPKDPKHVMYATILATKCPPPCVFAPACMHGWWGLSGCVGARPGCAGPPMLSHM